MLKKIKIATVIGARPQFVKAATTSRAIMNMPSIEEVVIHTGQHFDENMSAIFFEELSIKKPHYHLGVSGFSGTIMTGRMIEAMEEPLKEESPDIVLVFGDTNSTLAGAIAASKLNIPCAHVEAGLRSFNRKMPEEINRIAVDHIADILFTPTKKATEQLIKEGIDEKRIFFSGDVMADALYFYEKTAEKKPSILNTLGIASKNYILATIHRQENTDNQLVLQEIMEGLATLSQQIEVVIPLHPRTIKFLHQHGISKSSLGKIRFIDPVGYLDMITLEKNALGIATDSGGVQKEAYLLQVPCFTLRGETEWVELLEEGYNEIVPLFKEAIVSTILNGIQKKRDFSKKLYGEGDAAEKIIRHIHSSY